MVFFAQIPNAPLGTYGKVIIRDLKTVEGVKNRLLKTEPYKSKGFKLFSCPNIYDESTFKLEYEYNG